MVEVLILNKILLNIEATIVIFLQVVIFIKCIKYLTGKDYTEEFLTFIRTEEKRSNVMTSARFQPFSRKHNINKGYYDGYRICPRNIREKYSIRNT